MCNDISVNNIVPELANFDEKELQNGNDIVPETINNKKLVIMNIIPYSSIIYESYA